MIDESKDSEDEALRTRIRAAMPKPPTYEMIRDLEAENAALTKRVVELEQRLRFTAESLRSLSPGPHPSPMNAEDYVPLIARLIESLQSQLAWTQVELQKEGDQ